MYSPFGFLEICICFIPPPQKKRKRNMYLFPHIGLSLWVWPLNLDQNIAQTKKWKIIGQFLVKSCLPVNQNPLLRNQRDLPHQRIRVSTKEEYYYYYCSYFQNDLLCLWGQKVRPWIGWLVVLRTWNVEMGPRVSSSETQTGDTRIILISDLSSFLGAIKVFDDIN